ncbi:MAG TPA: DUF5996 family protein [Candidatus Limnocylindria bacterium]|nr:DUF5996 family protein [Candidatus Limnocylindria bacterium]
MSAVIDLAGMGIVSSDIGMVSIDRSTETWPSLPYAELKDTLYAVHMWTQIVGKIRMALTPLVNHWWNSSLLVTPRGLTTTLIPQGDEGLQIDFDFIDHELVIVTSGGGRSVVPLRPMSVAQFYREVLDELARLGVADLHMIPIPVEIAHVIPFAEDREVRPYDRQQVRRFHDALLRVHNVFDRFRADFLGKASPVQFFWGGFDLASARFSGRRGPAYAGGSAPNVHIHVMHEAYSHELIAAGFWMGDDDAPRAEFYSYAMPAPAGIDRATIRPQTARWVAARGEFLLPYDAVRTASDPAGTLLAFLQSTYDAAADLGGWDRPLLEERPNCDCVSLPSSSPSLSHSHSHSRSRSRGA